MFINYNIGNSVKLLEECKNIMKNDYFVYIYIDKFNEKCKETIIENYIFLNETIDLNDLSELFNNNIDDTEKYTKDVIKFNYPLAEIIMKLKLKMMSGKWKIIIILKLKNCLI